MFNMNRYIYSDNMEIKHYFIEYIILISREYDKIQIIDDFYGIK